MKMRNETGDKDTGLFVDVLGENATNKVVEYFLVGMELDHALGRVAEDLSLSRPAVYNIVDELVEKRVLKPTRKAGGAQLYMLDRESFYGQVLYEAYKAMLRTSAEKVAAGERPIHA